MKRRGLLIVCRYCDSEPDPNIPGSYMLSGMFLDDGIPVNLYTCQECKELHPVMKEWTITDWNSEV